MRFIAGAIVILAGSLLWGLGASAVSKAQAAKANVGDATMATYGGMTVVVAGLVVLVMAHTVPLDRQ